jgi:hypothetical protein
LAFAVNSAGMAPLDPDTDSDAPRRRRLQWLLVAWKRFGLVIENSFAFAFKTIY